MRFCCD